MIRQFEPRLDAKLRQRHLDFGAVLERAEPLRDRLGLQLLFQRREIVRPPRTGWGRRTSLFQWRQPAFWVYAIFVVLTAVYAFAQQRIFQELSPSGWALSWALLIAYGLPLFLAIYLLDLYEREPLSLVIGALVWGAVAATALSAVANDGWGLVVARIGGPAFAAEWERR